MGDISILLFPSFFADVVNEACCNDCSSVTAKKPLSGADSGVNTDRVNSSSTGSDFSLRSVAAFTAGRAERAEMNFIFDDANCRLIKREEVEVVPIELKS